MSNTINVLIKERRRIRALAEVAEKYGVTYLSKELETIDRVLALLAEEKT